MSSLSNKKNEEEKVISIIKSIIASVKDSLTLEQLQRDYKQLIGSPIPFKTFQYGTLASFLQNYPKVVRVSNYGGQQFVKAVPSEQTSHIENLIRGQKKSKSKGSFSKPKLMRKPQNLGWVPPANSYYSRPQSYFPGPYRANKSKPPLLNTPYPGQPSNFNNFQHINQPQYRTSYTESKSGNYNVHRPTGFKSIEKTNVERLRTSNSKMGSNSSDPANIPLSNKGPASKEDKTISVQGPPSNEHLKKQNQTSYKTELVKEAKNRKLSIKFNTTPVGKSNISWVSLVTVGQETFRSYPQDFKTPLLAEEYVSALALKSLSLKETSASHPSTKDFDLATERIRKILAKETVSVWWEHVRELYNAEFQEEVEYAWVDKAYTNGVEGIDLTQPQKGNWILQLKKELPPSPHHVNGESTSNLPQQPEGLLAQPPLLTLPKDKIWNVYISNFKDCSEVWFRLIGEEYSEAYEDLVTNMELHYMSKENCSPASNLKIGGYYVCSHEESFSRVQLISFEGENATVFFFDYGDNENVPTSQLLNLEPKFLELPCQSIKSSLAGLEFAANDPIVHSEVQNLVLGKPLLAEVLSREKTVSVVLYDTSTAEDINVNERLLQLLSEAYPEPQFPPEGNLCEVYVSHVTPEGDIYVIVELASYNELENLLTTAKERAAEILGDENLSIDIGKLYLAKFTSDGKWQRAAPRSSMRDANGKVLLKALDSGIHERIASANIVPLDKVAPLLSRIPPQSLLCRLHDVPSAPGLRWTQRTSERLLSIVPSRLNPMLLKVIKKEAGKPASVELFQRIQEQNLLASINVTLDTDSSLFSNEDKNNNLQENGDNFVAMSLIGKNNKLDPSSPVKESLALQALSPPPLPKVKEYFDVFVTCAASPSNFIVQSYSDTIKLDWLMGEMKSYYSNPSNRTEVKEINRGGVYALLHDDESWYRVQVEQVADDLVTGVFVDYGDCFISRLEKIQHLWPNFKQLAYQALKAELAGVAPNNIDWTPEDSCRFREVVENRELVSVVAGFVRKGNDKLPTLVLHLFNTKDPRVDVNIGELLVQEKRAIKLEQ